MHIPSKYKLAECVSKWCVELSIPGPPRRSLQSACFTSHSECFYRSLFANGMNPLLCACHLCCEKLLFGAQQDKKDNQWQGKEREQKKDETGEDRRGYLNTNRGADN